MKKRYLLAAIPLVVGSASVHADQWGCEVLLCLSNPAGPMAVQQCVPPIQRLYRAIFKAKPDPFPTCPEAGNNSARVDYNNHYDPCPEGTTTLGRGASAFVGTAEQVALAGRAQTANTFRTMNSNPFQGRARIIGIGEQLSRDFSAGTASMPKKVCVGKMLGIVTVTEGSTRDDRRTYNVPVYDHVAYLDYHASGSAIKVYMNGRLTRIVRP